MYLHACPYFSWLEKQLFIEKIEDWYRLCQMLDSVRASSHQVSQFPAVRNTATRPPPAPTTTPSSSSAPQNRNPDAMHVDGPNGWPMDECASSPLAYHPTTLHSAVIMACSGSDMGNRGPGQGPHHPNPSTLRLHLHGVAVNHYYLLGSGFYQVL